jgi:hypothetical protein
VSLRKLLIPLLIVLATAISALVTVVVAAGGLEYNIVTVIVPTEIQGSFQTIVSPLNVSSISLLSEANTYVLTQGQPRIGYLFSRNPPVMAWIEPSAYSGSYDVWYGGDNPYSQYLGAPGTQNSIWLAFDDFDYSTGFWINQSIMISGSRATIGPGGYLALTNAYSGKTEHLWLIHGRKAYVLLFPNATDSYVYVTLTSQNFTDITSVIDGSDVYFLDQTGACLYYNVIYFDKANLILYVAVNPANNTAVYLLYGGTNECPTYRVS